MFEEKLSYIQKKYAQQVDDKLKAYECNKDLLDISVVMQIPKKKIYIDTYLITPTMNMNNLKEFLFNYFAKLNDPIQNFNLSSNYLLIIPIGSNIDKEIVPILNKGNLQKEILKYPEIIQQSFDKDLLLRSLIKSKAILMIVGDFSIKSDSPPECVSYNFPGKIAINYFSCNNCGIKCLFLIEILNISYVYSGICQNCREYCHKDHNTGKFLENHEVDWGCCYCSSKGFCKYYKKSISNIKEHN